MGLAVWSSNDGENTTVGFKLNSKTPYSAMNERSVRKNRGILHLLLNGLECLAIPSSHASVLWHLSHGTHFVCAAPACSAYKKHALLQTAGSGLSFTPYRPVPNWRSAAISAKIVIFHFSFLNFLIFLDFKVLDFYIYWLPTKEDHVSIECTVPEREERDLGRQAGRSYSEF